MAGGLLIESFLASLDKSYEEAKDECDAAAEQHGEWLKTLVANNQKQLLYQTCAELVLERAAHLPPACGCTQKELIAVAAATATPTLHSSRWRARSSARVAVATVQLPSVSCKTLALPSRLRRCSSPRAGLLSFSAHAHTTSPLAGRARARSSPPSARTRKSRPKRRTRSSSAAVVGSAAVA